MTFSIDKDTDLYCSFAEKAGSKGCKFHNAGFQQLGINAIYKSFSVTDIRKALEAVRTLGIKGCAVTMPFKQIALEFVDSVSAECREIGATNTILNRDGILTAHNTDWMAAHDYLEKFDKMWSVTILGNGGYAAAVRYAATGLGFRTHTITREVWSQLEDVHGGIIYNCTPVEDIKVDPNVHFIDCGVNTDTGAELARIQAKYQFKMYTGQEYPC